VVGFRKREMDRRNQAASEGHQRMEGARTHLRFIKDNTGNNQRGTIVKEIAHINFPTLTVLCLEGNHILSIEAMPSIAMQYI
jgi:hypothetical protein